MRASFRPTLLLLLSTALACEQLGPEPTGPDGTLDHRAASEASPGSKVRPICDPDNGGLTLPGGFCGLVVHDAKYDDGSPARARHVAVAPNGDVFVAIQNPRGRSTGGGGGVLALRDTDGDGEADETEMFGPNGGHGLFYRHPFLWFATDDQVIRYEMGGQLTPLSGMVIVSGMPNTGDHRSKTIAVTEDGTLFVNLGSASDACQEINRRPGSPGVDPCPEMPIRSGIWRYGANIPGQVHSPAARYLTGTRNMVAMTLNPFNGELYGVQHGRDNLNTYWPDLFTPQDQAELPDEEFFRFKAGADYGWPYCYYDGRQGKKVLAPEYGGDGSIVGRCAATEQPILTFPAHWAPNGMHFYSGDQFPGKYREGAFIAFHGGFNRPDPFRDEGFNVVFVRFRNGMPSHQPEIFADGFVGENAVVLPRDAEHRPVGLAEGPDGSLFITDDDGGRIWRVLHASRR